MKLFNLTMNLVFFFKRYVYDNKLETIPSELAQLTLLRELYVYSIILFYEFTN